MASDFEQYLEHLFEERIALPVQRHRQRRHHHFEFDDPFADAMWTLHEAYAVTEMFRLGLDPYDLDPAVSPLQPALCALM